jgi:glycosyltransferase involved in cell wall biosynthesis
VASWPVSIDKLTDSSGLWASMNLGVGGKEMENQDTMTFNLIPGDPVPKPPEPRSEAEIIAQWKGDIEKPLVSIVCHTYNHEHFIEDALNGFLMQETDFPFEIIVHDDASVDNTKKTIELYVSTFPQIIKPIIQNENIYQQGLRPTMFSFPSASGKYIAFCEGDDYWIDESKLKKQVDFLEKNPEVSVCYTDSIPFKDGEVINKDFRGSRRDLSASELKRAPAIFTLTSCFRNVLDTPPESALVKYGDKFIWSRLGNFGSGKFLENIKPSLYRVHPDGIHSLSSCEDRYMMNIQTYTAMSAYYQRLGDEDLSKYFLDVVRRQVYSLDGISLRLVPAFSFVSRALSRIGSLLRP